MGRMTLDGYRSGIQRIEGNAYLNSKRVEALLQQKATGGW